MTTPADDVNATAAAAYLSGADPLVYAEILVAEIVSYHYDVATARIADPDAYPEYSGELGPDGLARRILGELLDAGWSAPSIRRPG